MSHQYRADTLARVHRDELLALFSRARMTRPQIAPLTCNPEFSKVMLRAYFPTTIGQQDRERLERDIGRILGKAVALRNRHLHATDQLQKLAEFTSI